MTSALRVTGALVIGMACGGTRAWAELPNQPQVDPQRIRVAIAQQAPQIDVAVNGRFRILALRPNEGTAGALREGNRLRTLSIRAEQGGIAIGEEVVPVGGLLLEPGRGATVTLNGQRLRGALEILRQQDVTLLVINHVELEDYLRGVLSKEAPHQWPMEALKALAIVARTYAVFQRLSKDSPTHDVSSDVMSQVYGGKNAERSRTSRAVHQTAGLILTYQDQIFPTYYHSTCGGKTEHGSAMGPFDLQPLRGGVSCSFCAESPFFRWQRRLSKADLAWAVTKAGRGSIWPVEDLRIVKYTPNGRVASLQIVGTRTVELSGSEFRRMLGFSELRSTQFAVVPDGDGFILQGRGWGHGVGLCQWGTAELARRGLSAAEILAFYYPGSTMARLGERPVQLIPTKETEKRSL